MTRTPRIFCYSLFFITSLVLLISGGARAEENTKKDTAHWENYSQKEASFSFRYPKGWEIIDDDFYVTAGGAIATQRSVNLQKIGDENSDDWIRINPRQFVESDGSCIKKGPDVLCTYSKDAEILAVLKKLAATFRQR